jgi:hypothetical protein
VEHQAFRIALGDSGLERTLLFYLHPDRRGGDDWWLHELKHVVASLRHY